MKIAFTGSHGTGKTTSVFNLAHSMKIDHPNKRVGIFHENAAKAPKGLFNKAGTDLSQLWIFTNQMQSEIALGYEYDILICDRTVMDSIAYSTYMKFTDISEKCFSLAKDFINTYDLIYFKTIQNNDFWVDSKHRDTTDGEYRKSIEEILMNLYIRAGMLSNDKFKII